MKETVPSFELSYDEHELVGRINGKKIRINLIILCLLIAFLSVFNSRNPLFIKNRPVIFVCYSILVVYIIYIFYRTGDKKIKLVINKYGIWDIANGLIRWNQMWYYYTFKNKDRKNELRIKLHEIETELIFNIDSFDIKKDQIMEAFRYYAASYPVNDLGSDSESARHSSWKNT